MTTSTIHLGGFVPHCAIGLSEIRCINGIGIAVLISLLTKLRSHGGELVLINPTGYFKKMLTCTKLNNIFAVSPDEAAARRQLVPAAH